MKYVFLMKGLWNIISWKLRVLISVYYFVLYEYLFCIVIKPFKIHLSTLQKKFGPFPFHFCMIWIHYLGPLALFILQSASATKAEASTHLFSSEEERMFRNTSRKYLLSCVLYQQSRYSLKNCLTVWKNDVCVVWVNQFFFKVSRI